MGQTVVALTLLLYMMTPSCCHGNSLSIGNGIDQPAEPLQVSQHHISHAVIDRSIHKHGRKLHQGGDIASVVAWGYRGPVPAQPLTNVVQIVAGDDHSLVLYGDGSVEAFSNRRNDYGQATLPAGAQTGKAMLVAANYNISAVVMSDGKVFAFGDDTYGLVTAIDGKLFPDIQDLRVGLYHAVALFRNGTAATFGTRNVEGQLTIPPGINGRVTAIAVGGGHNLFLLSDGSVQAAGYVPGYGAVPLTIGNQAVAVAAGVVHSVVLLKDGTVVPFGESAANQLDMPATVKNVGAIACGRSFTLALQQGTGKVFAWGYNADGQINVPLSAESGVVAISTGSFTSFAIKSSTSALPPPPSFPSPTSSVQASPPPVLAPQPPVPSPTTGGSVPAVTQSDTKKTSVAAIAGGIAGGVIAVIVIVALLVYCCKKQPVPSLAAGKQNNIPGNGDAAVEPWKHFNDIHNPMPAIQSIDGSVAIHIVPPQGNDTQQQQLAPWDQSPGYRWDQQGHVQKGYEPDNTRNSGATGDCPSAVQSTGPQSRNIAGSGHGTQSNTQLSGDGTNAMPHTNRSAATGRSGGTTGNASSNASRQYSGAPSDITQIVQAHLRSNLQISWSEIKIGGVLGKGGFGQVFKGTWRGNRVAVKMLNFDNALPEAKAMLHQEALIMCQLNYPNIVRIFGLVDEEQHQAVVMQYHRRGTLASAMSTLWYQELTEASRLNLAYQVACGMCFLHERQPAPIIHGDLKTSNLLLEEDGSKIYIADFGLACKLHSPSTAMQMGALTASISPPEVLMAPTAPRTAAADVFAFGVVVYEMMTGRPAFRGMVLQQIKSAICDRHFPPRMDNFRPSVASLIIDCTAYHADERPHFAGIVNRLMEILTEVQGHCNTTMMLGARLE